MEKEYLEIRIDHPYFKGLFTKNKLLSLIELKENEGWRYVGNISMLEISNFKTILKNSNFILDNIVAVLERNKSIH